MFEYLKGLFYPSEKTAAESGPRNREQKFSVKGKWDLSDITRSELLGLDYKPQTARVKEWCSAIQIVCPYCDKIQATSTALDVIHNPSDYWGCESCGKLIGLLEGKKH